MDMCLTYKKYDIWVADTMLTLPVV